MLYKKDSIFAGVRFIALTLNGLFLLCNEKEEDISSRTSNRQWTDLAREVICAYRIASTLLNVADGIVMGTAARVIRTADSRLQWAATPGKAVRSVLKDTAAGGSGRAGIVRITSYKG